MKNQLNQLLSKDYILKLFHSYPKNFTRMIRKSNYDFYQHIDNEFEGRNFSEKLYRYIYKAEGKCYCGNNTTFGRFSTGFLQFCSLSCSQKHKSTQMKRELTSLQKYGTKHPTQAIEVKRKNKKTKLERYGNENYNNRSKAKRTCNERYNVDHYRQTEMYDEQRKRTCNERYGVDDYNNRDKAKDTWKRNYPEGHPQRNKLVRDKVKNTCNERYSEDHPMHVSVIANKCKGYKHKIHITPSGKELSLQGYESQSYDLLLKLYDEGDILSNKKDMPKIYYNINNSKHRYYPDFFIPKDNLVIEVKSQYTMDDAMTINLLKEQATKMAGYEHYFHMMEV